MNPIVITQSCFGAVLPSQGSSTNIGTDTLATSFLQNGAAAYIGSTAEVETVTASRISQLFGAPSGPQGQVVGYFYNQLSAGMTLGQALQSTQAHFANSGLPQQQVNALALQLYGDPTLQPFQSPAAHH